MALGSYKLHSKASGATGECLVLFFEQRRVQPPPFKKGGGQGGAEAILLHSHLLHCLELKADKAILCHPEQKEGNQRIFP